MFQAELLDALRRRRGRGDCTSEDDEDLGLPHSPCNSPTTADVLLEQGLKVTFHHKSRLDNEGITKLFATDARKVRKIRA